MLVDPIIRIIPEETKQKIIESCGEYIDLTPKHIQRGLFYADLNFNFMIENIKNDFPSFSVRNKMLISNMQNRLINNPKDEYAKRILDLENQNPENIFPNKRKLKNLAYRSGERWASSIGSYGVCDTPSQLLKLYDFEKDHRKLSIGFTPIFKEDQPKYDGWRWSKWGRYIGRKKSTAEYLYDEKDIEYILIFQIIELK